MPPRRPTVYRCGTATSYRRGGCRCALCVNAATTQRKMTAVRTAREGPAYVPAEETAKRIKQMNRLIWSYGEMEKETGIAKDTLWRIARGKSGKFVHRDTAAAVKRLWDDVYCDGDLFDPEHPTRLKGGNRNRGPGKWDRMKIAEAILRKYGHYESLTSEDKEEISNGHPCSNRMAERLALKHGFMPWEVWEDWGTRQLETA